MRKAQAEGGELHARGKAGVSRGRAQWSVPGRGTGYSNALGGAGLMQAWHLGGAGRGVGCRVGLDRGQLGSEAQR